jgi:hypothetical protein
LAGLQLVELISANIASVNVAVLKKFKKGGSLLFMRFMFLVNKIHAKTKGARTHYLTQARYREAPNGIRIMRKHPVWGILHFLSISLKFAVSAWEKTAMLFLKYVTKVFFGLFYSLIL